MKTKVTFIAVLAGLAVFAAFGADEPTFKDNNEKVSYAIGQNQGAGLLTNLKRQELELNIEAIVRGYTDGLAGKGQLSEQAVRETLTAFQQELNSKQQEKRRKLADENKAAGEKFLAENKTKPGVITTESGLQYKVITEGKGETPGANDVVEVNYRGTLIDGTEFDSSAKSGHTASFGLTQVIKGWTEAIQKMKVGSKWQLFIPSDLAYGEFGRGQQIGPNATLLFDIELVSTKPQAPAPPAAPLTSDIIKVPSAEEMKKGAKIETIKADEVDKYIKEQKDKEKPPEKK